MHAQQAEVVNSINVALHWQSVSQTSVEYLLLHFMETYYLVQSVHR